VIHEAGPYNAETMQQTCTRCGTLVAWPDLETVEVWQWDRARQGEVLVGHKVERWPGRSFPTGALVEVTRWGRCMVIDPKAVATCHELKYHIGTRATSVADGCLATAHSSATTTENPK